MPVKYPRAHFIVTVREDIGFDHQKISEHPFHRESSALDFRLNAIHNHADASIDSLLSGLLHAFAARTSA